MGMSAAPASLSLHKVFCNSNENIQMKKWERDLSVEWEILQHISLTSLWFHLPSSVNAWMNLVWPLFVVEFQCKHQYTGNTGTVRDLFGASFVNFSFWEVLLDQFTCDKSQNTTMLRMSVHINFACVSLQCPHVCSIHAETHSHWFTCRNDSVTLIVLELCICRCCETGTGEEGGLIKTCHPSYF